MLNDKPFTDSALAEVTKILETRAGLTLQYGFDFHAQDPDSYRMGGLEWSERGFGTRYYITTNPLTGRVDRINVINLSQPNYPLTKEELVEINQDIQKALNTHNQ